MLTSANKLAAPFRARQMLKLNYNNNNSATFNLASGCRKLFANSYWDFASCAAAYCLAYPFLKQFIKNTKNKQCLSK